MILFFSKSKNCVYGIVGILLFLLMPISVYSIQIIDTSWQFESLGNQGGKITDIVYKDNYLYFLDVSGGPVSAPDYLYKLDLITLNREIIMQPSDFPDGVTYGAYPLCFTWHFDSTILIGDAEASIPFVPGRILRFYSDSTTEFVGSVLGDPQDILVLLDSSIIISDYGRYNKSGDGFVDRFSRIGDDRTNLLDGGDYYGMCFGNDSSIYIGASGHYSQGVKEIIKITNDDTTLYFSGIWGYRVIQSYNNSDLYVTDSNYLYIIRDTNSDGLGDTSITIASFSGVWYSLTVDKYDTLFVTEYFPGPLESYIYKLFCNSYSGPVWHVNTTGNDETGNGSESNPFATIQHAIDLSVNGDTVLVHDGTYTGDGNRDIDFCGKSIVVKSENGPEYSIINCELDSSPHKGFIFNNCMDTLTTLEGFQISGGPDYPILGNGGGISFNNSSPKIINCIFIRGGEYGKTLCDGSSPRFDNCKFRLNYIPSYKSENQDISLIYRQLGGAALRCINNSQPTFNECIFEDNIIEARKGGALACLESSPSLKKCLFKNNRAGYYESGGAVYLNNSPATFDSCIFINNNAMKNGGAICLENGSSPSFNYCIFDSNKADWNGGAIYSESSTPEYNNCLFINNRASLNDCCSHGGAIYGGASSIIRNCIFALNYIDSSEYAEDQFGGAIYKTDNATIIENCIFAFNFRGGAIWCDDPLNNPTINCTNIFGNAGGDWVTCIADQAGINGNMSLDPLFCDTANNDFSIYNISPCAPENNSCEVLIGAFEVGCYVPMLDSIAIDTIGDNQHVLSDQPLIQWNYNDEGGAPQTQFEIAVGTDDDWTYAEMWNPAPYETSDTFVVYNGATLVDGETYYLRLRVNNGIIWSEWHETTFRMNSIPSIPAQLNPISGIIVETDQPAFWIENSTDTGIDSLTYDYMIYDKDSMMPGPIYAYNIPEQPDSTGWQIDTPLPENWLLFWKARSFDQYEYSEWSESDSFWVNTEQNSPYEFQANYPPDTGGSFVYDMLPTFLWAPSFDPDPFDSVYYTLLISIDSDFTFVNTTDSIWQNEYTKTDSLDFTTRYWWKVKATDNAGLFIYSSNAPDFRTWMLGDVNADWNVDLLDILFLINYKYKDGPAPDPMFIGDVNADCEVDLLDVLYLIQYKYKGGPEPMVGCE